MIGKEEKAQKYWLFVGTYTRKEGHVDGQADGLYWYELDTISKKITLIDTYKDIINPSYLTISPNNKFVYAVSEISHDNISAYGQVHGLRINSSSRKFEFINKQSTKGEYPCFVSSDNAGKAIMVANYGSGNISYFPINEDGSIDTTSSVMQHNGNGPNKNRQEGPHAHMIIPSPDNKYLLSSDLGTEEIYSYSVNYDVKKITKQQIATKTESGSGPRHLVFHPLRNIVYVVKELNGTIDALSYDSTQGKLKGFQTISTVPNGQKGDNAGCADIHITHNGAFLYASNRGNFNNIAMYKVSKKDGSLSLIGHQSVKGRTPRNFLISPDGKFLLVANQDSNNIIYFNINQRTGELIDINVEMKTPTPVCLKIMPVL